MITFGAFHVLTTPQSIHPFADRQNLTPHDFQSDSNNARTYRNFDDVIQSVNID